VISWFDIAYAALNIIMITFCLKQYTSPKKQPFKLLTIGFIFLFIANFVWLFTYIPLLNEITIAYGYVRLALYAAFTISILYALRLFTQENNKQ